MKLLIIEDDATTLDYIVKGFHEKGHSSDSASTGPDGLYLATTGAYDVIVLDRMLPQMDGLTVLNALRATNNKTPVIILSALGHVDERIKGLCGGSDDYLAKPFSFQELLVRCEILHQRHSASKSKYWTEQQRADVLHYAHLSMDLIAHKVFVADQELKLQPKEFRLLRYLLEHQEQVVSRTQVFEAVWDYHFDPKTNVIDVHVARLRKKLEAHHPTQLIHTIRGTGYVLRAN